MTKQIKNNLSIIDLFCGVGGLSLGAARAGFRVVGAMDNDPIGLQTHQENFPSSKHLLLDLTKISGKNLLNQLGIKENSLTGIVGGPPCQGFSLMGKNNKNDIRNEIFINFFRLVKELKPQFYLCENVPGLLRSKFDSIRNEANKYVINDYKILPPITINASHYGVPTSRTRVFFIGYKNKSSFLLTADDFKPHNNIKLISVREALKGLPIKINPEWQSEEDGWQKIKTTVNGQFGDRLWGNIPPLVGNKSAIEKFKTKLLVSGNLGTYHTEKVLSRWRKIRPGKTDSVSWTVRLDPYGLCPTLRAGTNRDRGGFQSLRPIHPTEDRVITPREAARLQGFPDWFVFHPTKWHSFRQIGNSVSPIIAEIILCKIKKKINKSVRYK
jgi:DNA (cytosine-5)-methyltransferase 1